MDTKYYLICPCCQTIVKTYEVFNQIPESNEEQCNNCYAPIDNVIENLYVKAIK